MLLQILWFWCLEAWEMARFICTIPFSWFWQPNAPDKASQRSFSSAGPIVLVPGFLGRGLELLPLCRDLEQAGFEVWIVPLGFQAGQIGPKGQKLASFLESHDLTDCTLVGYSLGGWVALSLPEASRWRVSTLITLGVAFQGTPMAYLLSPLQAARQLLPGSPFLAQHPPVLGQGFATHLNFYAQADEITASHQSHVLPKPVKTLSQRQEARLPVWGHLNLVRRRQARSALVRALRQGLNPDHLCLSKRVVELEQDILGQLQPIGR